MNISRIPQILAMVLLAISCPRLSDAADLTLTWDPPSDGVTTGYMIYVGQAPQTYSQQVDVGFVTSFTVTGLSDGTAYYVTVRAYDATGALSDPASEVTGTTQPAITGLTVTSSVPSPQVVGTTITFTAAATGGVPPHEFQFSLYDSIQWTTSAWTTASTTMWTPSTPGNGYWMNVAVRSSGSSNPDGELVRMLPFTITAPLPRINVAAAANGGKATASSISSAGFAPGSVIDGDRKGLNWGHGGGWRDKTQDKYPDWLQIDFAGSKTIDEIDVFTIQDAYTKPVTPTLSQTFTLFGVTGFQVQYWDGTGWLPVPGGVVSANGKVWRQFFFAGITTSRIRVWVDSASAGNSRLIEVEAYGH